MTENDINFPLTLQKKGKEVKIYRGDDKRRGESYFTVVYYTGNHRVRVNRTSFEEAKILANQKLEEMVRGRVPVSLEPTDWEMLKELKRVAGERNPWRFLEDARAASLILKGTASMAQAAEFWISRHQHRADIQVSEAFEEYIRQVETRSSERNLRDARNRVGRFDKVFGAHAIGDINAEAILHFLESMDVEKRTKNNYRAQIITFFRWARKRGYLEEGSPTAAEKVDPWKVIEKEVVIFTPAQTRHLFEGIREDLITYAAIGAFAGLRPSEIRRLTWNTIDFESGHIHVTAEVARKVNRARYVPMSPNLIALLKPRQKSGSEKVTYFKADELLSADAIKRKVIKAWPTDVLRHSFCSYRLALTSNIGQVAEEAGNSPSIIRTHYRRPVLKKLAVDYFEIGLPTKVVKGGGKKSKVPKSEVLKSE